MALRRLFTCLLLFLVMGCHHKVKPDYYTCKVMKIEKAWYWDAKDKIWKPTLKLSWVPCQDLNK